MLLAGKRLFAIALCSTTLAACGGGSGGMVPGSSPNGVPAHLLPTPSPQGSATPGPNPQLSPTPNPTPTSPWATPTPRHSPYPTPSPRYTPTPRPTTQPTPTPAPTSTPSGANVAKYYGCPVFTAGDYYNADVSNASVDPHSADYINGAMAAGNTDGFVASDSVYKVNDAADSTPQVTVHQKVSYHQFPLPYPWQNGYYIEPLGDAHAMVAQTQSCHVYESYGTSYSGGKLSAYSGANWDLTKPFVPLAPGNPSSMASGLSLFAGMVKWEDYQSGAIDHALDWDPIEGTNAQWDFVRPAADTDGWAFRGSSLYQIPYGAHLRLKASFSTAGWGPEATMVANALKRYGMYLSDTGSSGNKLFFANAQDGSNPWNGSDLAALGRIHLSDFDVLTLPAIQRVPGH